MVSIRSSVTVNRPLPEVFRFVEDNQNAFEWMSGLLETRITNDMRGRGKAWVDTVQVLGRRVEVEEVLTEYEHERFVVFKSTSGPIPLEGRYEWEPDGQGTKVTFTMKGEPGGFFRLAEPLVARSVQRQWDTNLANLKDLLEQDGTQ